MGQKYSHLSLEERTQLSLLVSQGLKQCEIAAQLGRSASAISRELARNRSARSGYLAAAAHRQADLRRARAKTGCRKLGSQFDTALGKFVLHELQRALSPEQIAGRLKTMHPDDPTQHVSHETIYSAVYLMPRGELRTQIIAALRQSHAKRLPRARGTTRKGNIADLVPLSERPAEADSREVPGHWEGDFIKGKRNASAIGTAIERTSRFVLLTQMNGCTATHALAGFTRRFNGVIPELRASFTYDRGSEMARHLELTEATGMPVYFCDPHSPWQRGSNENVNGLVRQFLPKGMDLSTVTPQKLAYIESLLNDRPRKILGFKTPREVYTELVNNETSKRHVKPLPSVALQA
jgi:IS30 family transposase